MAKAISMRRTMGSGMGVTARREMFWQIVRYGVNGTIVTSLYSAVLVALDSWTGLPLQICNFAGYLAGSRSAIMARAAGRARCASCWPRSPALRSTLSGPGC
jgi:hypothetical protein